MRRIILAPLLAACATSEPEPEPVTLSFPDAPEDAGVAVGVRTFTVGSQTVDVWYPAAVDAGTSEVDLTDYLPAAFVDALGDLVIPTWTQRAVLDAPAVLPAERLPLVVFSHGFGGFRAQSTQLTAHLASRGYVVVSADHPGRDLATLAPCLLAIDGVPCEAGLPGGDDVAVADVTEVLDGLRDVLPADILAQLRPDGDGTIGIFGHSAGGGTTTEIANEDPRIGAALPMAGGGAFTRALPSLVLGGACDAIVTPDRLIPNGPAASLGYWSLDGAGHLAFSDLCLPDLGAVADALEDDPRANGLFLTGLRQLATDGCPGYAPGLEDPTCADAFAPLDATDPPLRALVTAFFDQALKGVGAGPEADAWDLLRRL